MIVGGHRQKRSHRAGLPAKIGEQRITLDSSGVYRAALAEFASDFGWTDAALFYWWREITCARMWCGEPQPYAEEMALVNVREVFDQRGRAAS